MVFVRVFLCVILSAGQFIVFIETFPPTTHLLQFAINLQLASVYNQRTKAAIFIFSILTQRERV